MNTQLQERIAGKCVPVTESGCWLWLASLGTAGYGQLMVQTSKGPRPMLAHRLSYEAHKGPVGDAFVRHSCDVKICVNPDHLTLGTHQDNMDDKVARNRQQKGEGISSSKLTAQAVKEIRASAGSVSQYELARRYGTSQGNISCIQAGKTWRHLLAK